MIASVEINEPRVFSRITLSLFNAESDVDLPMIIPELLLRLSAKISTAPFEDTIPELTLELEGLVFWLLTAEARIFKSPPARISDLDKLLKLLASILKLSADCIIPELEIEVSATILRSLLEEIFLEFDKLFRMIVILPFD